MRHFSAKAGSSVLKAIAADSRADAGMFWSVRNLLAIFCHSSLLYGFGFMVLSSRCNRPLMLLGAAGVSRVCRSVQLGGVGGRT